MAQIIKFNGKVPTGIATPKFLVGQTVQNLDPDLFVRMLYNHPGHIERSKAKKQRIAEEKKKKEREAKEAEIRKDRQMIILGFTSVVSTILAFVAASFII